MKSDTKKYYKIPQKMLEIFLQDLHNFLYLFLRIVSYKRNSYRIPFCIQICNID